MFTLDNVKSVYSGKPGCACGCIGKHTKNSASTARSVKILFNKVMNNPTREVEGNMVFVNSPTRMLVLYFN